MAPPPENDRLAFLLRQLDNPLLGALGDAPTPIWIADRVGTARWLNAAATALLGARPGLHFSRFVDAEDAATARELFARKIHGRLDSTVQKLTLTATAGPLPAEVTSVPIRDGADVLGVITLVRTDTGGESAGRRRQRPRLSSRQLQVLELLAHGRSTGEIAAALQITEATVRNHIRFLLTQLGVHTRLEAVVLAFRSGWL